MKHTKTPWIVCASTERDAKPGMVYVCHAGKDGTIATVPQTEGNAALIVRAVNCHDELLNALKAAMYQIELHAKKSGGDYILKQCLAAVLKAEGG